MKTKLFDHKDIHKKKNVPLVPGDAEREKELLLSFSNDLASVRDKEGLKGIIKQYLKDQFQLTEYMITLRNEDNKTYCYFLHDLQTSDPTDEGFKMITGSGMSVEDTLVAAVLRSEQPVIFNIAEVQTGESTFPGASFWQRAGAKQIRGMRLKVRNEDIGIIWTQPERIDDKLLQGISAQIAITISNMLAYEKIANQFEKITSYKQQLEQENGYLQEEIGKVYNNNDIIGSGAATQKVIHLLLQVAHTDSTVLILGETGTGKELVARAIHLASKRKDKPMVKVNCAALAASLIESELFGHERGAFTSATERRVGKFELADTGTLFLDEIGEMPLELQVKLLRAIQEKEIERIGGKATIKTDVRIIAATNRNLCKEVEEGRFRSDLYYRLNVFPITLPPLREHKEDIPLLAVHFLLKHAKKAGRKITHLSAKALRNLAAYDFPGNVRELEHVIERSIISTNGKIINEVILPVKERKRNDKKTDQYIKRAKEAEQEHILFVLEKCKGKIFGPGGAAEILQLPPSTLNSRIKQLGIKRHYRFEEQKHSGKDT